MSGPVSFFVVGAPKSGTTSLYYCLKQHPDIFLPAKKELHYFSYPELSLRVGGPGDKYIVDSCVKDINEYRRHYRGAGDRVSGDISPSYLFYSNAAERINEYNPNAKIIVLLRDHVGKVYSQYSHLRGAGREPLSLKDALRREEEREKCGFSDFWLYKKSSLYSPGVRRYIDIFGANNVKVIFSTDLANNSTMVLNEICEFIEVNANFKFQSEEAHNVSGVPRSNLIAKYILAPNAFTQLLRKLVPSSIGAPIRAFIKDLNTGKKEFLDDELRAELERYFSADKDELEAIIKRSLPW